MENFEQVLVHEKTHSKNIEWFYMPGFLGDKQNNIVHHLANMKEECQIINIGLKDKQYFDPDTLENAQAQNFSPCKLCTGN